MANSSSLSSIPNIYDAFLYAPVFVDGNGTPLSVLSAIARGNADPWDEAARLAAMPKAAASTALAFTLDLLHNKSWDTEEASAISTRLVGLLPGADAMIAAKEASVPVPAGSKTAAYWIVCFYVAMSLSYIWSSHQPAAIPTTPTATSTTTAPYALALPYSK